MSKEFEFTGKHMLIIMLTFFGIIFTVNGIMIYHSQSSWTGLETHDAYRKGIKYNTVLSDSEAQNKRGWSLSVVKEQTKDGLFKLTAEPRDKAGERLTDLALEAKLKRPTHEGMDQTFSLKEVGIGVYKGEIQKLPLGKWYLFVTARKKTDASGEVLYRSKNDLYLR